jgi:hypothetical protein
MIVVHRLACPVKQKLQVPQGGTRADFDDFAGPFMAEHARGRLRNGAVDD